MSNTLAIILGAVEGAIARVAADPSTPLAAEAADAVGKAVSDAVAADPAVQNVTDSEPWYLSRVTLGAILAAIAPVAALFGHAISVADQASVVDLLASIGSLVGAALALYGRWFAKTPIGS